VAFIDLKSQKVTWIKNPLKDRKEFVDGPGEESLLLNLRWRISDDGVTLFLQRGRTDKSLIFSKTSKKAKVIMHIDTPP